MKILHTHERVVATLWGSHWSVCVYAHWNNLHKEAYACNGSSIDVDFIYHIPSLSPATCILGDESRDVSDSLMLSWSISYKQLSQYKWKIIIRFGTSMSCDLQMNQSAKNPLMWTSHLENFLLYNVRILLLFYTLWSSCWRWIHWDLAGSASCTVSGIGYVSSRLSWSELETTCTCDHNINIIMTDHMHMVVLVP